MGAYSSRGSNWRSGECDINPYLNYNGNAEEAFNFYKSVLGGEFSMVQKFKDVPKEEKKGKIVKVVKKR